MPPPGKALIVDIDGVVSPVHGRTAWGDDVTAGNVFGPVLVSPGLCARLDDLAQTPGLSCWWLTSWSVKMRAAMRPFPGPGLAGCRRPGPRAQGRPDVVEVGRTRDLARPARRGARPGVV